VILLSTFVVAYNPIHAEDTEIYVGNGTTDSDGVRPNVLFMLDTSGSMTGTVDGITRLDHMKEALRLIINQSNNVNMGLMRFHKEGGPVLYPVTNINEPVEEEGESSASDLVIQVKDSADDAEQYLVSGTVELTGTDLELTKIAVGAATVTLPDIAVNLSSDDVEEHQNGSMESNSSSDLELMKESDVQKIGIRFQGVAIPAGATITSAAIEFQLDETGGRNDSLDIKILGHKVANSTTFSGSSAVSSRISANPTGASVIWTPPTGIAEDERFDTADLTAVVQEIVDQGGWATGNAMSFLFQLESAGSGGKRIVESYNGTRAPRLKVSYTTGGISSEQKVGLRFQEVMIPKGATITSAVLEFEASTTQTDATSLTIHGEDIDDSPAFAASANNISFRTLTTASVAWNSVPSWTADATYQSPDIKTIIQEQVNRSGWCGGQSLSFILSGVANSLRKAKSYDNSTTAAPILRVSYDPDTVPVSTCIHQVIQTSISTGSNDVEESSSGNVSTGSSDLELIRDGSDQTIGLRFTNVAIPKDTTIVSAELIFSNDTDEPQSSAVTLTIKGEDVDDSDAFTTAANNVSGRTTTGSVSWTPSAWGSSSELHSTSDIGAIVQTIVNRAGWESGNAMSFFVTGSGSNKRVANSFEGNASVATRLRVVVSGGVDIPVQTVRDKLLETVDNLQSKSGTPILDVMYEAGLYYRGEDVLYGRTRGFGATIGDGTLGDNSSSGSQYTRVSNPLSWTGTGTIVRPSGCTEDNPNDTDCKYEYISGSATYKSPITESCQANYQILLSDGSGYGTNSVSLVNTMMTDTPTCSGHNGCAEALSGFLHTKDQMSGDDFDNDQTIATYTIGFNLAGTNPDFLQDIANAGGGTFHTASTAAELADVFQTILSEVLSSTSSFSAPSLSVSAFNKIQYDSDIYYSTFLPDSTGRWAGNLKKFKLCEPDDENCTEGTIVDKNDANAIGSNGQFLESSTSFWSTSIDGNDVKSGGAGSKITYPRKIYIEDGSVFTVLTEANGDAGDGDYDATLRALLDPGTSLTDSGYLDLVKWILGRDIQDENDDNDATDDRWALGDALHSQPLLITYGKDGATPIKKIFVGTNDGLLHMFNTETGEEEWAFMPDFMTGTQNQLMVNANGDHISGIDGNIRSWIIDNDEDGIIEPLSGDKVYIYFGMRRGGRHLYALDVTPTSTLTNASLTTGITPSLVWKIEGGSTTGFEELGQTWSAPKVNSIWYDNAIKKVLIFAGGYHPGQDSAYGPSAYGNGIYIVDALTGALLWRAGLTDTLDGDNGVEFADMKYPIPSDVFVLDTNADGAINRLYVGDTGGQVWRMDFINASGGMTGTGAVLADISSRDESDVVAAENKRKFFYPPSIALVNDYEFSSTVKFDAIVIASGDRSSPNGKTVHNRLYMFRDYVTSGTIAEELALPEPADGDPDTRRFTGSLTEADLYDATTNAIQNADGSFDTDEIALLRDKSGYKLSLVDGTSTWIGEKALSKPLIKEGVVYFTTYIPSGELIEGEVCAAPIEGTGRIYGINLSNAGAAYKDWAGVDDESFERADRVYKIKPVGIPSGTTEGGKTGGILLVDGVIINLGSSYTIYRNYWKEL